MIVSLVACPFFLYFNFILADRTAAHSRIAYWHDTVISLSVCLSVTKCIVVLRVSVGGWKLYHRVLRRTLPIHFFRH